MVPPLSTADGNFRLILPEYRLNFTGERMTPEVEGKIEFEHFHRYCLARDLCNGLDVLDVASGEGYGSAILAEGARSVTGVDVDSQSVDHAREAYRIGNLRFLCGDAVDLPVEDASVDVVVSFETLEHIREHAQFIAEVKRVLRPGGRLIVSTPERAVYSARGEPVNEFHLLELTEAEFESPLRSNFKHVSMLHQRAVLGSVIASRTDTGLWRSYERRSTQRIEASSGLARAPYLIAVATDIEFCGVFSSVYIDRRDVGEVVQSFSEVPTLVAQLREHGVEIAHLSDVLRARDEEIARLASAKADQEAEIARLASVKAGQEAQIAQLAGEAARLNEELASAGHETQIARLKLVQLQNQYDKIIRSRSWRFAQGLVYFPRTIGRSLRWPFARVAFHKNGRPRGWLRPLLPPSRPKQPSQQIEDSSRRLHPMSSEIRLEGALDAHKQIILVVSHDASRSGGPILALNLIQLLTARYNVISLLLGGGELTDDFRLASKALYVADRGQLSDLDLSSVVRDITTRFRLTFAIVNTIESRRALPALKEQGVPTVSLIHEFASYVRPRSIFNDVITLSSDTVFSTRITLENAIRDIWLFPSSSIHIEAQGKCIVPSVSRTSASTRITELWSRRKSLPHEKRTFLVIGVGTVEFRKGVDLFISCATILRRQESGERFQFLWIGGGFNPERDSGYSAYLYDQVKRADLESCFEIASPTADIELAYETADLLLLASRLDPLPNVAIDALTVGLPVVCFENTTGIADFLIENGLGAECVASYLDTADAARKVTALADSDDLRARVSDYSREAAKKKFDMTAYASKIEGIALQAATKETRVREEVNTILGSGLFRYDFFAPPNSQSIPKETLVEMYVRSMASGLAIRKPMPGFHPTVYAWLKTSGGEPISDPFADFLREGLPEGSWLHKVIQSGTQPGAVPNPKLRTALHLHAYYPDQLPEIVNRLSLNACAPDMFISAPSPGAAAEARRAISAYRGRVLDLQVVPNLGRNFGPLLTQFGKALCADYDVIGHVHTKKSVHADQSIVNAWKAFLIENMIGGQRGGAMLDAIQSAMAIDPTIGIVFPDDPNVMSWTDNRGHAQTIAARMKCAKLPENFNFPIGSMFWVRSSILASFVELDLDWSDYPSEPVPIDGTIIHAVERLFGALPVTMGMNCAVTNVRGVTR